MICIGHGISFSTLPFNSEKGVNVSGREPNLPRTRTGLPASHTWYLTFSRSSVDRSSSGA